MGSFRDLQRMCHMLDVYMGFRTLDQITGDLSWSVVQKEFKRGRKPATINRYLALIRNLLRISAG